MNEYMNISQIENWLHTELRGTVSDNVFAGSLPETMNSELSDMVLIDIVSVTDGSDTGRTCGEAIVNVFLYVAPTGKGQKNVAKMNRMENAFNEAMYGDVEHEHYSVREMYSDADYDKSLNYHYKVIALQIQIF